MQYEHCLGEYARTKALESLHWQYLNPAQHGWCKLKIARHYLRDPKHLSQMTKDHDDHANQLECKQILFDSNPRSLVRLPLVIVDVNKYSKQWRMKLRLRTNTEYDRCHYSWIVYHSYPRSGPQQLAERLMCLLWMFQARQLPSHKHQHPAACVVGFWGLLTSLAFIRVEIHAQAHNIFGRRYSSSTIARESM